MVSQGVMDLFGCRWDDLGRGQRQTCSSNVVHGVELYKIKNVKSKIILNKLLSQKKTKKRGPVLFALLAQLGRALHASEALKRSARGKTQVSDEEQMRGRA